jgi:hypothetical protein
VNKDEWVQMLLVLLNMLREILLSQPQMDLNHFVHPFPRAKNILLESDKQVHMQVLLNMLLFDEGDEQVQK